MSKILVTGGSGFIGSHFHRYIPNEQIINLDLLEPTFPHTADFIQGDIRKIEDLRRAVKGHTISTILSLAAKHHDFGIGHDEYFDTNEEGTMRICEVATENNIKEIVFYSSVAVYGTNDEVSSESSGTNPDGPYGASKLAGERVLEKWAAEDTTRKVMIIRPTVVYGPNNMANMRNLIKQIDSGFYFHVGKSDNVKSIAYVENLVMATLFLITKIKPGLSIYNYADEPQLPVRQISSIIADALGKKIYFSIPTAVATLIGLPFDMAIKITGKNLPISSARIKKLATQTFHSAQKVRNEGFQPQFTTIQGLHKMIEWYRKERS